MPLAVFLARPGVGFQGAVGYVATIVNGEIIMENGEYTGAVPGALIRGTQPAPQEAA